MLPADNTGGREANSPAMAAAARARRVRLERTRQGLDSGTTPAATAAQVPAITPAVGTADAMDGGIELATGNGDVGDLPSTGAVRQAIQALTGADMVANQATTGQAAGDAAGYKTPAQTQTAGMQPQGLPQGAPPGQQIEGDAAATLAALQGQQHIGDGGADFYHSSRESFACGSFTRVTLLA